MIWTFYRQLNFTCEYFARIFIQGVFDFAYFTIAKNMTYEIKYHWGNFIIVEQ